MGLHTFFAVGSSVLLFSLDDEICKEIVNEMKDSMLDMNTCKSIYIQTAWITTLTMAISMLLKVHILKIKRRVSSHLSPLFPFFRAIITIILYSFILHLLFTRILNMYDKKNQFILKNK